MTNNTSEAYTKNHVDHTGDRTPGSLISFVSAHAGDDRISDLEVNTKASQRGEMPEGLPESTGRGMHEERSRELGRPREFPIEGVGQAEKVRLADGSRGVRSAHSTRRRESRSHGEGADSITKSPKETPTGHAGSGQSVQTSLERIANKARREKAYRFRNLYRLLNEELLMDSWVKLNRHAATGVDDISWEEYSRDLHENIRNLTQRLKQKRYRAKLVRRHYIPKGNGKMRPLGIPAIEDKLVQHAVAQILQSIYEGEFLPSSYGYRPGRGAKDAVLALKETLWRGRYRYVVEADIRGFFDNIDHEWMVRMLEERIQDNALIRLIRRWLKAGVLDTDGKVLHPATGVPQGGIVSPMLSNIYMHYVLNLWFEKVVKPRCRGKAYLCVYADDFVCAFEDSRDAALFYKGLGARLAKFGLELASEKTRIIPFGRGRTVKANGTFDFLGFEYRWAMSRRGKKCLKTLTSGVGARKSIRVLAEWCREKRHLRLSVLMAELKAKLRGYLNYYGVEGNMRRVDMVFHRVRCVLFKWLNRRSQRSSFTWESFNGMLRRYEMEEVKFAYQSRRPPRASCGSE